MTLPSGITIPEDQIARICRKYNIRELAVFGSAARGDARPDSDIDVLVEFRPGSLPGWEFFGIAEDLEAILGRPVDLGTRTRSSRSPSPRRFATPWLFMRSDRARLLEMLDAAARRSLAAHCCVPAPVCPWLF
jgi:predicted nucleotidyltransferase